MIASHRVQVATTVAAGRRVLGALFSTRVYNGFSKPPRTFEFNDMAVAKRVEIDTETHFETVTNSGKT